MGSEAWLWRTCLPRRHMWCVTITMSRSVSSSLKWLRPFIGGLGESLSDRMMTSSSSSSLAGGRFSFFTLPLTESIRVWRTQNINVNFAGFLTVRTRLEMETKLVELMTSAEFNTPRIDILRVSESQVRPALYVYFKPALMPDHMWGKLLIETAWV